MNNIQPSSPIGDTLRECLIAGINEYIENDLERFGEVFTYIPRYMDQCMALAYDRLIDEMGIKYVTLPPDEFIEYVNRHGATEIEKMEEQDERGHIRYCVTFPSGKWFFSVFPDYNYVSVGITDDIDHNCHFLRRGEEILFRIDAMRDEMEGLSRNAIVNRQKDIMIKKIMAAGRTGDSV